MSIDKSFIKGAFGTIGERVTHVKEMVGHSFDGKRLKEKNKDKRTGYIGETEANYYYMKSKIATTMYEIENILSLKISDPFTVKLKQCYEEWILFEYSLERFRNLYYIRKAYYRQGKIFDLVKEINELIDSIKNPESADVIKTAAYTNCVFNIKACIKEMKNENSGRKPLSDCDLTPDLKKMVVFIKNECSEIQSLASLSQAYKIGSELKEMQNDILTEQDVDKYVDKYGKLTGLMEEFRSGKKNLDGLDALYEQLRKKKESNEKVCENNEQLYEKLIEVFTDDWFEALNYKNEDSCINKVPDEEIKDFYINHMAKANEIIEEYKKD